MSKTRMMMVAARGVSKERSINDSISKNKCIVTLLTQSIYFIPSAQDIIKVMGY
jgi:hypothetical protein